MYKLNIKILILTLLTLVSLSSISSADTIEDVISKINSIENRIKVLEKATFNNTTSSTNSFNAGNYEAIITKQSIQIVELQNQIQELTGSIEEVLFSLQTLISNYNNFKADTEMRFSDVKSTTTQTSNQALFTSEQTETIDSNLEPKSLGTLQVPLDEEVDSSQDFAVLDKQEIIATVDQESLILLEEKKPQILLLPEGSEQERYEFSINLLTSGDYPGAEAALKEFILIAQEEKLLSNAYFWLAETYYVRENYKDAAKNYLSIYLEHPNSSKAPNGLLKLGISLIKMGQLEQGCASLVKLRISYPETDKSLLDRGDIEIQRNGCKTS